MAATIVTRDPTFGWIAYGGALTETGDRLTVSPRDGLRRRFDVVIPDRKLPFAEDFARLKIELDRDGFAAGGAVTLDKALGQVAFTIENRTGDAHTTTVRLSLPVNSSYTLTVDGKPVTLVQTGDWDYPWRADVSVTSQSVKIELRKQ
jgi:hypothetical protein